MVNEQQLLIEVSRDGQDLARVRLIGEMDMEEQRYADLVTDGVIASKPATVELDLSELRFLDSSGMRALLQARKVAQELGVRLVLDDPQPTVRKVLEITLTANRFEVRTKGEQGSGGYLARHPELEPHPAWGTDFHPPALGELIHDHEAQPARQRQVGRRRTPRG